MLFIIQPCSSILSMRDSLHIYHGFKSAVYNIILKEIGSIKWDKILLSLIVKQKNYIKEWGVKVHSNKVEDLIN